MLLVGPFSLRRRALEEPLQRAEMCKQTLSPHNQPVLAPVVSSRQ